MRDRIAESPAWAIGEGIWTPDTSLVFPRATFFPARRGDGGAKIRDVVEDNGIGISDDPTLTWRPLARIATPAPAPMRDDPWAPDFERPGSPTGLRP